MLAIFTDLQTGQESSRASHASQQQRCLHGRIKTHETRELQALQAIFSLSSDGLVDGERSQHDSASWAGVEDEQTFSLITCSILVFNESTIASFSVAILCHVWISISILFKQNSNSAFFLLSFAMSSSFCLSKKSVFASSVFISSAICCFLFSCIVTLNLSFCTITHQNKVRQKEPRNDYKYIQW